MARTGDSAAAVLETEVRAPRDAEAPFYVINIGGTGIGTGVNAPAGLDEEIVSDSILLSSGPRAGLAEVNLPAQQHGSFIMPGKVLHPVMLELMNLVAFQAMGNDLIVTVRFGSGEIQIECRLAE